MVEIEKNIPVPKKTRRKPYKYPFPYVEIGDSFFVAGKNQRFFGASVSKAGKTLGCKFTVRTVEGGVRVWRIA